MVIKLVHLLTEPDGDREIQSTESLEQLIPYGFEYVRHVNPRWTEKPPIEGYSQAKKESTLPGAYGGFSAHRRALQEEFDTDLLVVCECDCLLSVLPARFAQRTRQMKAFFEETPAYCVALGWIGKKTLGGYGPLSRTRGANILRHMTGCHCLVYPRSKKEKILEDLEKYPWESYDFWLSRNWGLRGRLGGLNKSFARQADGWSLVDGNYKTHFPYSSTPPASPS
jgi:hypothetical protein